MTRRQRRSSRRCRATARAVLALRRRTPDVGSTQPLEHCVARYVGRYGWVTAEVTDEEALENALEWLRESYWLNAPARLRGAVEGT